MPLGENNIGIDVGPRPSVEITINNIALSCENCGQVLPEGILSLRPRKEARFICSNCLQLNLNKIEDNKKSGNGELSSGCT